MSSYIKATNFATKDTLSTGNPNKIIKGTEIDTEFNAIASAVASKSDMNSPTFTGIPEAPTASAGTNTTQLATTAFVTAERTNTSTLTNKTLTSPTINTPTIAGGSISGITDLAVADGGTGASTLAANNVLLGNGTSALQTVAPGTNGNLLTSNGTTWVSAAAPSGGVTSVATGNGLSGGTITTTGTLVIACPASNTVGSYASVVVYVNNGGSVAFGSNYPVGSIGGDGVVELTNEAATDLWATAKTGSISGTWKFMTAGANSAAANQVGLIGIACRVS